MDISWGKLIPALCAIMAGPILADTISTSISLDAVLPGSPASFTTARGNACATIDGSSICDSNNPGSQLNGVPGISASASFSGPATPAASPLFTSDGSNSINGPFGDASSNGFYQTGYAATTSVSQLDVLPTISINTAARHGTASDQALETVGDASLTNESEVDIFIDLTNGNFSLNPTTSTMSLTAGTGSSGELTLQTISFRNGSILDDSFLDWSFATQPGSTNPVVTQYTGQGLFGLALPGIGQNPSFSLSINPGAGPFTYSFPALNPSSDPISVETTVSADAAVIATPEPSTAAALLLLAFVFAKQGCR